jgi:hypothetical protein
MKEYRMSSPPNAVDTIKIQIHTCVEQQSISHTHSHTSPCPTTLISNIDLIMVKKMMMLATVEKKLNVEQSERFV